MTSYNMGRIASTSLVRYQHPDEQPPRGNLNTKPRKILTRQAFRNAAALVLAVSGSINAIKHLQATPVEAGLDLDFYDLWEEVGRCVPVLNAVCPNGKVRIEQFEDAGGAAAVLQRLSGVIDTSVLTCTGRALGENLAALGSSGGRPRAPSRRQKDPGRCWINGFDVNRLCWIIGNTVKIKGRRGERLFHAQLLLELLKLFPSAGRVFWVLARFGAHGLRHPSTLAIGLCRCRRGCNVHARPRRASHSRLHLDLDLHPVLWLRGRVNACAISFKRSDLVNPGRTPLSPAACGCRVCKNGGAKEKEKEWRTGQAQDPFAV